MNPLPGEQTLVQADSLTVTTHRVRQDKISWGAAQTVGIMLEDISSCALLYRSYYVWLILAALSIVGGLTFRNPFGFSSSSTEIGVVAALVFAVLFFVTRRQALLISPAGGLSIVYVTGGSDRTQALHIIDTIEAAKDARAASLRGPAAPAAFPPAPMPAFSAPQPVTPPITPLPVMPPVPPVARICRVCGNPMASPTSKFCQACGSPQ
jgi:hypothetical protein